MTEEQQGEIPEIVRAGEEHLEKIAALADSRSLKGRDGESVSERTEGGFLVSAYSVDDYRARLRTAEHFYVALKGGDVVAFLLAYSSDRLGPDEWLNRRIKTTLGDFLVIKQICVAREAARHGIASLLYHHVLEQWRESPVIAAVVNEPPNVASARFHQKLGFEELTRLTPPDGLARVVWVRRRQREALLQAQYSVSVDLYKHEDSLNWQKLNNFFYITAGLAAAMGFSLDGGKADGSTEYALAVALSTIGFGVSAAFSQMLRFGWRYLLARKAALTELEERLTWYGGARIVTWRTGEPEGGYLAVSPTGLIMVLLPVLVGLCWLGILGFLFFG
jgi:predicted GNAT superfamily acetyltransferase